MAVNHLRKANAPQGRSAPFTPRRVVFGTAICQIRAHVMEKEIGIRVDGLVGQGWNLGVRPGDQGFSVALGAPNLAEERLTAADHWMRRVPLSGDGQGA